MTGPTIVALITALAGLVTAVAALAKALQAHQALAVLARRPPSSATRSARQGPDGAVRRV